MNRDWGDLVGNPEAFGEKEKELSIHAQLVGIAASAQASKLMFD